MTKTITDSQKDPAKQSRAEQSRAELSWAELVYKAKQAEQIIKDTDPHQHPDCPEAQQDWDICRKSYSTSRDAFPDRKFRHLKWKIHSLEGNRHGKALVLFTASLKSCMFQIIMWPDGQMCGGICLTVLFVFVWIGVIAHLITWCMPPL